MSIVGINIKKIRSVKGLNQTDFANLFGLTRANIGSYEELRAEPKIDTIIKIASYYKLPIDKLVRKELTVNDISNFDVFSKVSSLAKEVNKDGMPFVSQANLKEYPKKKLDKAFVNSLKKIVLPFDLEGKERIVIFNEGNDLYFKNEGFLHGDLLILEKLDKLDRSILGVAIDESSIYKGFLSKSGNKLNIRPVNINLNKVTITNSRKVSIWRLIGRYTTEIAVSNTLESRLELIESKLRDLESL